MTIMRIKRVDLRGEKVPERAEEIMRGMLTVGWNFETNFVLSGPEGETLTLIFSLWSDQ